jgi:DNA mismatch repair ATPase MutS
MINTMVHYKVKGIISGQFPTIDYIGRMVRTAYNICQYKDGKSGLKMNELQKAADACRSILKKRLISQNPPVSDLEFIYEYINIFLLIDERNFFNSIDEITLRKEELKNIFLILGEADALISFASYREGLKNYCEPKLSKSGAKICGINMRHPLLDEGVPNSFSAQGQGAVITGSNMSGKSTFLRTLGINTLFSQTICTCIADEFSSGYMKVMSSISQGDNLVGGKSYYLAEAESLLRIIKAVGDNIPALCIIDEIFRGTNPIERVNASVEILKYLIDHNTIVVVATHDLEITEMVKDSYSFYYFSEDIGDEGLKFDYKIKPGISKNRNAVKLMKYLGYPEEIIQRTMNRVADLP